MGKIKVDVGISFDGLERELREAGLIPDGEIVKFIVKDIDDTPAQSGRPMFTWKLQIVDHEKFTNKYLPWERTVLPYINEDDILETSGVFRFVNMLKSLGMEYAGTSIEKEDYLGKEGTALMGINLADGTGKLAKGDKFSVIKKLLAKEE